MGRNQNRSLLLYVPFLGLLAIAAATLARAPWLKPAFAETPKKLVILDRSSWDAVEPKGSMADLDPSDVEFIVVHHFEVPSDTHATVIKKVQHDHMYGRTNDNKGLFKDIGYHYIIAQDANDVWRVYEGRSTEYRGAHAPGRGNAHGIAVAFAGNYLHHSIPDAAKQVFFLLVDKINKDYKKKLEVLTHAQGEYAAVHDSDCPGTGGLELVLQTRKRLDEKL